MSRKLPQVHSTTAQEAGPYRLEHLDLEFSNGERRLSERLHGRGLLHREGRPEVRREVLLRRVRSVADNGRLVIDQEPDNPFSQAIMGMADEIAKGKI